MIGFSAGWAEQCAWGRSVCDFSGGRVGEPGGAAIVTRSTAAAAGLRLFPEGRGFLPVLVGGAFLHHL